MQHARLHLLVQHSLPGTASARVAIPFFAIRDSPAFAALLSHQSDYVRSQLDKPLPKLTKVLVLGRFLVYCTGIGMRDTLAVSRGLCLARNRQRSNALGGASAMTSPNFSPQSSAGPARTLGQQRRSFDGCRLRVEVSQLPFVLDHGRNSHPTSDVTGPSRHLLWATS